MLVVVQVVRGSDAGGSARNLTGDQAAGRACCACNGPDPTQQIGWIAGETPARIHPWCVERWRHTPDRAR